MNRNKNNWVAYEHIKGGVFIKRIFSDKDLEELKSSPFLSKLFGPVLAETYTEASKMLLKLKRLDVQKSKHNRIKLKFVRK